MSAPEPKNFDPKTPVSLNPPKDDPISLEELATADGSDPNKVWVAIKGVVFDVSGNKSYLPGGSYNVFAGKDASRGLAKSSVKQEDAVPQWNDLGPKEKQVLEDWFTFFSKRYNVLGKVPQYANL
ncbi:cytochrome b5-like heme/steroid binding domain-containing protein [Tricharina praecox]|uniref:cytochrome b5-like heme/steroid binding domain-containing protein n=1 Tax=Tricharina praecox TaxID=43433 RepID=UPI00221EC95E|nr:cytochrome b5-like heme/steroid binding domain-containing protein [Tricharina praecox]KAI5851975.1 cytochrome b5-like heme/steroid binding domain-containing protein [Tricharina praecox]